MKKLFSFTISMVALLFFGMTTGAAAESLPLERLYASPASGSAPLAVTFTGTVPSAGYSIDFGDGATSGDINCGHGGCPATNVVTQVNVSHTYQSAGTYTAKLRQHFASNAGNCAGADCNVVATATVTVGSTAPASTFSISPTSGSAPLAVTFTGSVAASYFGGVRIEYGDGATELACRPGGSCSINKSHTYSSVGTFTARLVGVGEGTNATISSVLITVSSNTQVVTGPNFSANPSSGTAPLYVSFSASGGSFTAIDFGDGANQSAPLYSNMCPNCNVWQPTHNYASPGVFAAKLINGYSNGTPQVVGTLNVSVSGGYAPLTPPPEVMPPPPPSGSCPIIIRRIARGSSGNDVLALQNYFISIRLLGSASATGYFGPLTEGAVQEWQAARGIVSSGSPSTSAWGAVGPMTRAALAHCGQ